MGTRDKVQCTPNPYRRSSKVVRIADAPSTRGRGSDLVIRLAHNSKTIAPRASAMDAVKQSPTIIDRDTSFFVLGIVAVIILIQLLSSNHRAIYIDVKTHVDHHKDRDDSVVQALTPSQLPGLVQDPEDD
ncbi:hypothetical protein BV22DRAFT_1198355 [Leucogyrophana mollusca]|uniref:Uncharacterized protein n=1 Tax=Leucogyrophana mollusca TaxID=85980 RepID=A0ACB8B624_9AGAM|nr:hypothetical protein BV22DRAFT_1198355 [Leucogyrophana mollusca]